MSRKGVYKYTIGEETRYADPREMHVKMEESSGGQLSTWINQIAQADQSKTEKGRAVANAARNALVEVTRHTFGLAPLASDGDGGYLWDEVYLLAIDFLRWCQEQKKNGVKSQSTCTSIPVSRSEKQSESIAFAVPIEQSVSASGCIGEQSVHRTQSP